MLLKLVVILTTGYFSINDLIGTTSIKCEVIAVKRTVTPTRIDIGASPKIEIASDKDILGDYQVAVRNTKTNKVVVLNNQNSLMRFKFNRKEIQFGLKEGEYYDILVHRKFGYKNILKIEHLNQHKE
jgi:hypothetical protein